jgi:ABC-2 type transport system ATP-binding protein
MSLIEKIADKIFLINNGNELYNGTLSGIYQSFGKKQIIELQLEIHIDETKFQTLEGVESVNYMDDLHVKITFGQNTNLKNVFQSLTRINGICDITSHKPDLHEIFLQLVKKQ